MKMMNSLEQHDLLYRLAYKKFLKNELEFARQLAIEAVTRAHEFYLNMNMVIPADKFTCRAQALLEMIERQSVPTPELSYENESSDQSSGSGNSLST